ncbi:hypothetical protein TEA_021785 [Camellia sinensis var. sinensis]|uniref:Uncharacterized protein n=1 Tax=Camellia sinensis var. sinensis TaxID=542762 RepID=A0A4S4EL37_CAMSN|nr:hypothetical protein TEA_021785 [Camellia sinensis var. sinensis]
MGQLYRPVKALFPDIQLRSHSFTAAVILHSLVSESQQLRLVALLLQIHWFLCLNTRSFLTLLEYDKSWRVLFNVSLEFFLILFILQYWNHGEALQPCKCPMCSRKITWLIPEASLDHCQDVEVLERVWQYNRLFVGGTYGLILVGRLDAIDVFDYFAIALIFILYIVGLYCRRQRLQHVRQLAADHP